MAKGKEVSIAGVTYRSIGEAARARGIPYSTVRSRVNLYGWTLEEALEVSLPTTRNYQSVVINGIRYNTRTQAAVAHGIKPDTVADRRSRGLTLDAALELEGSGFTPATKKVVVGGVTYLSLVEATNAYSVRYFVFYNRLHKLGWTLEQALGIDVPPNGHQKCLGRIYQVCHVASGKKYIGVTLTSIEKRWAAHVTHAHSGKPFHPDGLQAAILLHGEDAFILSEVAVGHTKAELTQLECKYIEEYCTMAPHGFNLREGGVGINSHTRGKPITVKGLTYNSIAQACRVFGVPEETAHRRLKHKWSADDTFSRPLSQPLRNPLSFQGKTYESQSALARAWGVNPATFCDRLKKGWPLEECLGIKTHKITRVRRTTKVGSPVALAA